MSGDEIDQIFSKFLSKSRTFVDVSSLFLIQWIHFECFSGDAEEYLAQWTEQFDVIKQFSWAVLKTPLIWSQIETTMQLVAASSTDIDLNELSPKVFQQYGYVKKFCSDDKIAEWNLNELSTESRWVQIFQHMKSSQVPYLDFARIVEFILCVPGTSAPVERIFSSVKNIWKT